jgi:hypothetical protein
MSAMSVEILASPTFRNGRGRGIRDSRTKSAVPMEARNPSRVTRRTDHRSGRVFNGRTVRGTGHMEENRSSGRVKGFHQ